MDRLRDGALHVIPCKTRNTTGVRLRIALSDNLESVVERCRDGSSSPFLVHRSPKRVPARAKQEKNRQHHTQVLAEQLSRAFLEARDRAGIGGDDPPTFQEIRSLGGAELIRAGWTEQQVQELMTHGSVAMTRHYLEGHEVPWPEVQTGIRLPRRVGIG